MWEKYCALSSLGEQQAKSPQWQAPRQKEEEGKISRVLFCVDQVAASLGSLHIYSYTYFHLISLEKEEAEEKEEESKQTKG
jgi:hypothetical protein